MKLTAQAFQDALQRYAKTDDAGFLQGFFKTGEGRYGAGDIFIGVRVPQTRAVCKDFRGLPLTEIRLLLESPVHEHRLGAVILLANQYAKADEPKRQEIYTAYLRAAHEGYVNNWDIVDSSAAQIVGMHLRRRPRDVLLRLAASKSVWERRISVVATFQFLREGDPTTTIAIAELLLHDKHDLIQKAVGWMLREMGKRVDRKVLLEFLDHHASEMPRTMLRYSIEHLPPIQRTYYLSLRGQS